MEMTIPQCKMARAALGWGIKDLATRAKVGSTTVSRFEAGQGTPIPSTVAAMRRAFEEAGIEFIPGGARLREQSSEAPAP
jgi:predicted transcriptional regulator